MKNSLVSKITLGLILISASTQAFGRTWNDWFKEHSIIKGSLVTAAVVIPAVTVSAVLIGLNLVNEEFAIQQNPGIFILKEGYRAIENIFSYGRVLSREEILLIMAAKKCCIGLLTGAASGLIAYRYPAQYCTAVGLTGASTVGLVCAAVALLNQK